MKKIISISIFLILLCGCGNNSESKDSDWPKSEINRIFSGCIDDGYSKKICDCVVDSYQNTFTYSEIEEIMAKEIEDVDDIDENTEKFMELLVSIFKKCKIYPE